jgi:hypothetical protein
MQFLLAAILFLVFDGVLIWYLAGSKYFTPMTVTGEVDMINVGGFVALIAIAAGLLVAIIMYLGEKFLYCGRREFPSANRAVRSGIVAAIMLAILLILHIFHFLNFVLGLVIAVLVVIGIIIIR